MSELKDGFARPVSYLRLSVTDRCDLRCTYCMAERMQFLPKSDLLSIDELARLSHKFIDLGIKKIRITGGEPLIRKGIMNLFQTLSARLGEDLEELTLTTNGTQLTRFAQPLSKLGVKRVNISLDSLTEEVFAKLSRRQALSQVLEGIEAAKQAGLHVKINTVLMPENLANIPSLMQWAHGQGFDMSLIEIMPMGQTGRDRRSQFLPMHTAKNSLDKNFTLTPSAFAHRHGGPSRYYDVRETGGRIGFISPLTHNFCASCNRIRLTCTGRIYMCLGQDDHIDLRSVLRAGTDLETPIRQAMQIKPQAHDFSIEKTPTLERHMSVTGG